MFCHWKIQRNLTHVIALSETWLNRDNKSSFPIPGFHPIVSNIRQDNSSRGGVALYVPEEYNFIKRPDFDTFIPLTFESIFTTIKDINVTIGAIYRSPKHIRIDAPISRARGTQRIQGQCKVSFFDQKELSNL